MVQGMLQPRVTWAEDRATQRCDPSADPGAKTEGRAVRSSHAAAARPSFGIGTKATNLRGTTPRLFRQDVLPHSLTPSAKNSSFR